MPYKYKRICPVCYRPEVSHLAHHLKIVHGLDAAQRKPYLRSALISSDYMPSPIKSMNQHPYVRPSSEPPRHVRIQQKHTKAAPSVKRTNKEIEVMTCEPYPGFRFRHTFSLMVCGPSQSGKSQLVKGILERNLIDYGTGSKQRKIWWFYGQYQSMFKDMKKRLGEEICFHEGLPPLSEDLSELNPRFNNICVLDDLMDLATDSPIVSKLFTQGRHRNASVILLNQNCFPKGKQNTSISRNAQYLALFRSPADRRQVGMVADRIFDKCKPSFMQIYNDVTSKPYSYVLIDNKPDTPDHKQVIVDVLGECKTYPNLQGKKPVETSQAMSISAEICPNLQGNTLTQRQTTRVTRNKDILRNDDPDGPLVITLSPGEWCQVAERFRTCQNYANIPGHEGQVWRVYQLTDYLGSGHLNTYPLILRDPQGNTKLYVAPKTEVYKLCYHLRGLLYYRPKANALYKG